MHKYVAVLVVHKPYSLIGKYYDDAMQTYRSPVESEREKVKDWVKEKTSCYPDAKVNVPGNDEYTKINYCIIHFEEAEGVNIEEMLDKLIK